MRFASNGYPAELRPGARVRFALLDQHPGPGPRAGSTCSSTSCSPRPAPTRSTSSGIRSAPTLMQSYLSTLGERAAKIAHYVNIDGATAAAPPGGVPTLAIWGMGNPARQIVGAENVYFPEQTHVQVATSAGVLRRAVRVLQRRAAGDDEHPARAPRAARRPGGDLPAEHRRRRRDLADLRGRRRHGGTAERRSRAPPTRSSSRWRSLRAVRGHRRPALRVRRPARRGRGRITSTRSRWCGATT